MNELQQLTSAFTDILKEAQKLRPQKQKWIGVKGYDELEWVIYERDVMLKAVNTARYYRGFPPITDVNMAEQSAFGHIDYMHKFALNCAELALRP